MVFVFWTKFTLEFLLSSDSPPVIDKAPTPTPGLPDSVDDDNTIQIGDKTCIPANGNVRIDCNTLYGSAPLTYEWRRDGVVIANPTPPNTVVVSEGGVYMCTVSNSLGNDSATSQIQGTMQLSANAIIFFSLV